MGHARNRGRHGRRGLALASLSLVAACSSSGRTAITPPSGGAVTSLGTVAPAAPPTTLATTVATTPAPTTTVAPLSPDLLAGGMVLCSFSGAVVPQWALDRLQAGLAAGLLLYQRNLASEAQAAANGQTAQAAALASPVALPAIVAADQEGGIVARIPGPPSSSAAAMGARPAPDVEAEGRATADLLLRWGVKTDLAPVADVARPGTFEARARRSFGADPAVAAGGVVAFVSGLRAGQAVVAAAAAGVDLFIAQGSEVCVDLQQALVAALADGRLPVARAQQAFDRVAELRRALAARPAG